MTKVAPLAAMIRRASKMAEQMFDRRGEIEMFWLMENAAGEQQNICTPIITPDGVSVGEYKDGVHEVVRDFFREHGIVRYVQASECWVAEAIPRSCDLPDDEGTVFVTAVPGAPFQISGRRAPTGKLHVGKLWQATEQQTEDGAATLPCWLERVTGPEAQQLIADVQADLEWREHGDGTLSTHPRRRELVAFHAEDGCEALWARREIIRPPGGNAYLGKLGPIERHDRVEGRFVGLLPTAGVAS
jgi:hypothetical protein